MAHAAFDRVISSSGFTSLPLQLELSTSRTSVFSRLVLILPAALAASGLVALLVGQAATDPATLALLADRPLATAQVAAGILLLLVLFVLPARAALARLWLTRRVEIAGDVVTVEERGAFGATRWETPLSAFSGVAHHIRASLSGLTHEIVLVHSDRTRSVTLMAADRVTQSDLEAAKALLRLPEVPARALYEGRHEARQSLGASTLRPARA